MTALEVQLLVSVATILCSGVISAIVTHKLASGRAEREFKRRKLEELYIAVHRFCVTLFTAKFIWVDVMRGKLTYDQGNELLIANVKPKTEDHETATMIVNIYFPKLLPSFDAIILRRDRLNSIHSSFKATYLQGAPCESFVNPYLEELRGIDADEKKLMEGLFQISKSLG